MENTKTNKSWNTFEIGSCNDPIGEFFCELKNSQLKRNARINILYISLMYNSCFFLKIIFNIFISNVSILIFLIFILRMFKGCQFRKQKILLKKYSAFAIQSPTPMMIRLPLAGRRMPAFEKETSPSNIFAFINLTLINCNYRDGLSKEFLCDKPPND